MAGTIVADQLEAASTSTLVIKNGVANTPPTIQDSAGTQIGTFCRAWVNFNGTTNTGGFCTIRASFNVTSVADNGTGNYTVNFTTAMPDVNYATMISAQEVSAGSRDGFLQIRGGGTYSTSAVQIFSGVVNAFNAVDSAIVCVSVFR
jgi:hypothetical protein